MDTSSGVFFIMGMFSSTLSSVLQAKESTAWIGRSNVCTTSFARLAAYFTVSSAVDRVRWIRLGLDSYTEQRNTRQNCKDFTLTLALPYVSVAYSIAELTTGNLATRVRNSIWGTSLCWTIFERWRFLLTARYLTQRKFDLQISQTRMINGISAHTFPFNETIASTFLAMSRTREHSERKCKTDYSKTKSRLPL